VDLERANDAHEVVRMQARSARRIDFAKPPMQPRRIAGRGRASVLGFEGLPKARVAPGAGVQPIERRADVETGAAHQERDPPACADRSDRGGGVIGKARGVVRLVGRRDVEQVVWHLRALGGARLGRSDVHAAVDLHRVRIHDLAVKAQRQRDRDGGLAGGGRAADHDDGLSLGTGGHGGAT
jgi:hypothetical protein